jgi:tetratricopeptide (TPR) repeat protein
LGADPKSILEKLYGVAQKADPNYRESYLASGELALSKHDFALAAKSFNEALKKFPDDSDLLNGLARAYQPNARSRMLELLKTALEKNKNHVPSLLLLVDHALDAEEYDEADKLLERALKVNPWHPEAWAYRAVLANLRTDAAGETEARAKALKFWPTNPNVDHLIGVKLSQKYRFVEGAAYQRQALGFDAEYLPAQIELAQDLLRLGEAEGWALAEGVHQHDGYDVTAYNLATLHGTIRKFQTITNEDFVLRMAGNEAALYGDRAMALLRRAKTNLGRKYGIELEAPTYIEIFPEQKDFAVRTFGMPHNPGFLGVCFGRVITANSPASQGGNPANWEAVLWHEFCHVVTLQMTKNKMPRWLSEGISVYEELQANPAWGQSMNPRYREMVLGEDLKLVSELSSAFMTPKSDLHIQFAYYQSALVVEYLVGKFGFEKLKAILAELALGTDINEAIAKHTAPMKQIEKEFAAFAKAKAEALGPELDWEKPAATPSMRQRLGFRAASQRNAVVTTNATTPNVVAPLPHPTNDLHLAATSAPTNPVAPPTPVTGAVKSSGKANYWKLMEEATELVSRKQWQAAKAPIKSLIELYPEQTGANSAYALLASVHRGLDETTEERAALEKWAARDADALEAYGRLMELAEATKDWKTVAQNAERSLAVNPLLPQPYRYLSRASEELKDTPVAIGAYEKLLRLDPPDPAEVHFRLAKLLTNAPAARRHVLQALEEAPRFRAAHQLLLELPQGNGSPTNLEHTP